MNNIIGIDPGSHSTKIVEIRSLYKGWEIAHFAEYPSAEGLRAALRPSEGDQSIIVTALPQASLRVLSLPFRDERKIDQVIPFEVEPYIPFAVEDIVVGWQMLAPGNPPRSEEAADVLVAVERKSTVRSFLDRLSIDGIDPVIVDSDPIAAAGLFPYLRTQGEIVALLDVGKKKTSVTVFRGGKICFARIVPSGGDDIGGTGRGDGAWGDFDSHVAQTFLTLRDTRGLRVESVVLCGGGSRVEGIRSHLEESLEMDVRPLDMSIPVPAGFDPSLYAKALALALRAASPGSGASTINFRKGEFAYRPPRGEWAEKLRTGGILMGIAGALAVISVVFSLVTKEARIKKFQAEARQVFLSAFPNVPYPDDPVQVMQELVARERGGGGSQQMQMIDLLREVSTRIGRDIKVDILELNIDGTRMRLLGATDSMDAVDRILTELRRIQWLNDVNVLDMRRSPDGNSVNFQASATIAAGRTGGGQP